MPQRNVQKGGGCCWKKFLGKAFQRKNVEEVNHCRYKDDEIISLNMYLTSLERKMQVIEEVARVKWYRQKMFMNKNELRTYVGEGLKCLTSSPYNQIAPSETTYENTNCLELVPASQALAVHGSTSSLELINEINYLGNDNFDKENLKSEIPSRTNVPESQTNCTTEPPKDIYWPKEYHIDTHVSFASLHCPKVPVKASCCINYLDTENKAIEIVYDNKEWDKKGTIILKDIENQSGVQVELIGRVVCFLLGMGEDGLT